MLENVIVDMFKSKAANTNVFSNIIVGNSDKSFMLATLKHKPKKGIVYSANPEICFLKLRFWGFILPHAMENISDISIARRKC